MPAHRIAFLRLLAVKLADRLQVLARQRVARLAELLEHQVGALVDSLQQQHGRREDPGREALRRRLLGALLLSVFLSVIPIVRWGTRVTTITGGGWSLVDSPLCP